MKRSNRKVMWLGAVALSVANVCLSAVNPEVISPIPVSDAAMIRASLVPRIEEALNRVCGSQCVGFSVMANSGSTKPGKKFSEDDLGFSAVESTPSPAGSPTAVAIEILTSKGMDAASQETVRLAIAAEAKNYTDLPVSVRAKGVTPPVMPTLPGAVVTNRDWMDFARHGLWPFALMALGFIGLIGLAYYMRSRRKMIEQINRDSQPVSEAVTPTVVETMDPTTAAILQGVISDRSEDLVWLAENSADRGDLMSIRKLIRLFPGDVLSKKLSLSADAASAFSRALATGEAKDSESSLLPWLKSELDRAHWKRLAEKVEPLAQVSRLSRKQLTALFHQVGSKEGKAVVLMQTPVETWPELLASMDSKDKLSVGTTLARMQAAGGVSSPEVQSEIIAGVSKARKISMLDGLVDDYLIHLSESEANALSNELASQSLSSRPRRSVEQMIQDLGEKELLELVLQLDIEQIRVLVGHLSATSVEKVMGSLPTKLRDRVSPSADKKSSEAEWLRTRVRLMKLYETIYGGGSVQ